MGLQEALDTVRPNERVMYRKGKGYMHFQYYPRDDGMLQLNVWYRAVDETGHEQLGGERDTDREHDKLVTIYEEMLRDAGIDPDHYRIIPIPPEWEQRLLDQYG